MNQELIHRDEPALTNASAIAIFSDADNSASFKFKQKITGKTAAGGTKKCCNNAIKIFKQF